MFQFPSSGKADPKFRTTKIAKRIKRVSIPFKRESGSKVNTISPRRSGCMRSFNSLQAGKRIQRWSWKHISSLATGRVSIPFKRESGSKVGRKVHQDRRSGKYFVFNSPSSGKADPKSSKVWSNILTKKVFQFPSSGKADPKKISHQDNEAVLLEFQFPSSGKADPKQAKA